MEDLLQSVEKLGAVPAFLIAIVTVAMRIMIAARFPVAPA